MGKIKNKVIDDLNQEKEKMKQTTPNREPSELAQNGRGAKEEGRMSNQETIDRWAEYIIPAVFKAEDALKKAKPEWEARLRALGQPGGEDPHKVAEEYCREIATIIVRFGSDYDPNDYSDHQPEDDL